MVGGGGGGVAGSLSFQSLGGCTVSKQDPSRCLATRLGSGIVASISKFPDSLHVLSPERVPIGHWEQCCRGLLLHISHPSMITRFSQKQSVSGPLGHQRVSPPYCMCAVCRALCHALKPAGGQCVTPQLGEGSGGGLQYPHQQYFNWVVAPACCPSMTEGLLQH